MNFQSKSMRPSSTIVAGIERLDDLTPILTAEFEGMAPVVPAHPILDLPHVVIEALGLLGRTDVGNEPNC